MGRDARIAILEWGPGSLRDFVARENLDIRSKWFDDGPELPAYLQSLEDPHPECRTSVRYAWSSHNSLNRAIGNLRRCFGFPLKESIGFVNAHDGNFRVRSENKPIIKVLLKWAVDANLDGILWVDFDKARHQPDQRGNVSGGPQMFTGIPTNSPRCASPAATARKEAKGRAMTRPKSASNRPTSARSNLSSEYCPYQKKIIVSDKPPTNKSMMGQNSATQWNPHAGPLKSWGAQMRPSAAQGDDSEVPLAESDPVSFAQGGSAAPCGSPCNNVWSRLCPSRPFYSNAVMDNIIAHQNARQPSSSSSCVSTPAGSRPASAPVGGRKGVGSRRIRDSITGAFAGGEPAKAKAFQGHVEYVEGVDLVPNPTGDKKEGRRTPRRYRPREIERDWPKSGETYGQYLPAGGTSRFVF